MTTITIDELDKVDIRVGSIIFAEAVPKSELLKLKVNFGLELGERQVLARIGKDYKPEELISLSAAFVVNLPPRDMKGMMSEGMILAAKYPTGLQVLFVSSVVPAGTRLS